MFCARTLRDENDSSVLVRDSKMPRRLGVAGAFQFECLSAHRFETAIQVRQLGRPVF